MLDEDDYADDSGDPELTFVRIEQKLRQKLQFELGKLPDESQAYNALYIQYINHVLAAADALGLDILDEFSVPRQRENNVWRLYDEFVTAVDYFTVRIKIANANGRRAFAVTLDASEKEKIRHFIEQIKAIIEKSSLSESKKESLFDKINDFLAALDKNRTSMQVFSDLVTGAAHTLGDAAEEAEPAWKWFRLIAGIFGGAAEKQAPQLPRPRKRDRIGGPPRRLPAPSDKRSPPDDEIPF